MTTVGTPTSRTRTSEGSPSWATAGPQARLELVLQLRDLVHDHLGPRRLLHHLRPGVEQRRPDRDLVGLADHLRPHPARGVLHVRARVGVPDRGRHLLVGVQARRPAAGAGSPAGSTSSGWSASSRRSTTPPPRSWTRSLEPLRRRRRRHRLRRRPSGILGETFVLFVADPRAPRADQHLLVAARRAASTTSRCGWHVFGVAVIVAILVFVPDQPPERRLRLHRHDQQLGLQPRACSGSTCCRSASC